MFDTLVYIPTILAYIFIILLLVILGFIVIYVTHKIYTTLYDNLPVAQLSSKFSISNQIDAMTEPKTILTLGTTAEGHLGRKSKTALRIIVTLEPCYLAYMMFEPKLLHTPSPNVSRIYENSCSVATSTIWDSQFSVITGNEHYLIKYFDSLSSIPTNRYFKKCDHFKMQNMFIKRRRRK